MSTMNRIRRIFREMRNHSENPRVTTRAEQYRAVFPPVVASIGLMGFLTDKSGRVYLGANGRSSVVGNFVYFSLNSPIGDDAYIQIGNGPVHNSTVVATNPAGRPLVADILSDVNFRNPTIFLRKTREEEIHEARSGVEFIFSVTGGICERESKNGQAFVWYQKWARQTNEDGTLDETYIGTGLAHVTVDMETGEITGKRLRYQELLFSRIEPAYGTFCVVREGTCFYTWGKLGTKVYLAKVTEWSPGQSELYEFWDGTKFSSESDLAAPVFEGYSHGTVFRTNMFGEPYQWAFVGLRERGEGAVDLGIAVNLTGPFKMRHLLDHRSLPRNHPVAGNLFVHPWASREKEGHLVITWNDNDGRVVGARLRLQMVHRGAWLSEVSLANMTHEYSKRAIDREALIKAIAVEKGVYYELDNDPSDANKVMIRIIADIPSDASAATEKVCSLIANWREEIKTADLTDKLREKGVLRSH